MLFYEWFPFYLLLHKNNSPGAHYGKIHKEACEFRYLLSYHFHEPSQYFNKSVKFLLLSYFSMLGTGFNAQGIEKITRSEI